MKFDVEKIREDFPILSEKMACGRPLVYFDNAATAQKPRAVIEATAQFYRQDNANIHRGAYELSDRATSMYEKSRGDVKNFLHAAAEYEAVFTSGATESLNIVAQCWGADNLKPGDEILLSEMEHHANIVPWQFMAERTGAKIKVAKITPEGELDMDDFRAKLGGRTKIVSIAHASNVLGTINDISSIAAEARRAGALISVDAAQSSPHFLDNLECADIDFLSLSSHKCFGPTGSGALVARKKLLDNMRPWKFGGDMIEDVAWSGTTFRPSPERFEAGTPNISGNVVFSQACAYLSKIDRMAAQEHEDELLEALTEGLLEFEGLKIFGRAKNKVPVVSFAVEGVHYNDISSMLNNYAIAVRAGHHCAEPLMGTLGLIGTCRASLAFYNTMEEVEYFLRSLRHILSVLR